MALRLASRTKAPPGGFIYRQKETNWESWKVDAVSQWDFARLCQALRQHRLANPQYKLNTNLGLIENEVDAANAARVAAMPNTESYVVNDPAPMSFPQAPSPILQRVVAAAKKVNAGAGIVLAFEKSGDAPVSKEHAEARALVCVTCPKNGKGDLSRFFTVPAAELMRKHLERLHDLELSTSLDDKLGVCEGCACVLKLKVHFPMKYVLESLTPEIEKDLQKENPVCWIRQEKETYERSQS
jgi:hypothetical protein